MYLINMNVYYLLLLSLLLSLLQIVFLSLSCSLSLFLSLSLSLNLSLSLSVSLYLCHSIPLTSPHDFLFSSYLLSWLHIPSLLLFYFIFDLRFSVFCQDILERNLQKNEEFYYFCEIFLSLQLIIKAKKHFIEIIKFFVLM